MIWVYGTYGGEKKHTWGFGWGSEVERLYEKRH